MFGRGSSNVRSEIKRYNRGYSGVDDEEYNKLQNRTSNNKKYIAQTIFLFFGKGSKNCDFQAFLFYDTNDVQNKKMLPHPR